MTQPRPNYWDYIQVEELLKLQAGLEGDEQQLNNDEVLFIVVHQVYELWFKLVLRELTSMRDTLKEPFDDHETTRLVASARRNATILRLCVQHFEVVETLGTQAFLEFRDKLIPASGFQSAQMRQMELLLGLDDDQRVSLGAEGGYLRALKDHEGADSPALERVRRQAQDRPTLKEALENWLERTPIDGVYSHEAGAEEALDAFIGRYAQAHAAEVDLSYAAAAERARSAEEQAKLQELYEAEKTRLADYFAPGHDDATRRRRRVRAAVLFIATYRDAPLLSWPTSLLDAVVELEQQFLLFRQRHARMVERVIGRRTGTGGSSGVDYLDETARYRVFGDLLDARTFQIRAAAAPPIAKPEFYGFQAG